MLFHVGKTQKIIRGNFKIFSQIRDVACFRLVYFLFPKNYRAFIHAHSLGKGGLTDVPFGTQFFNSLPDNHFYVRNSLFPKIFCYVYYMRNLT